MPLVAFASSLLASLLIMPLVIHLARRTGYVDQPHARKLHTQVTPLLGGAGVFAAALIGWGLVMVRMPHAAADWEAYYLLAGAGISLAVGLWDDRFGMQPSVKVLGQAAAAAVLIAGGGLPDIGLPIGITGAIALVLLIALMNAVNFLDNMNGMVGGISAITLAAFAWTSLERGTAGIAAAQLAMAGACAGFLPYNFPKARLFLGDAGSLLLGYSLGASALLAMKGAPAGWAQLGPVLMLAYPAFDMTFVVISRVREGRPVYQGGKDHTNHRLARVLGCPIRTVMLLWVCTAALCVSGISILHLQQARPTLLLSGLWMILLCWSGLRLSSVPSVPQA